MKNEAYLDDAVKRLLGMPLGREYTHDQLKTGAYTEGNTQSETTTRGGNAVSTIYHIVVVFVPTAEAALVYVDGKYAYFVHEPGEDFSDLFEKQCLPLTRKEWFYRDEEYPQRD